jgi:hypothetical protein
MSSGVMHVGCAPPKGNREPRSRGAGGSPVPQLSSNEGRPHAPSLKRRRCWLRRLRIALAYLAKAADCSGAWTVTSMTSPGISKKSSSTARVFESLRVLRIT